jgi:hypothetical protein
LFPELDNSVLNPKQDNSDSESDGPRPLASGNGASEEIRLFGEWKPHDNGEGELVLDKRTVACPRTPGNTYTYVPKDVGIRFLRNVYLFPGTYTYVFFSNFQKKT